MRIGIIRGPYLNEWEMQNYEPIQEHNELTAFASASHMFNLDEIKFPVVKLFSLDRIPNIFSRKLADIFNKLCNILFGWNYYLFGLEKYLKDIDVVHTMETFHTFTKQALDAKKKYGNRVIIFVWEDIPFSFEKNKRRIQNKKNAIENADLFIAPTKIIGETLKMEGVKPDKIRILPVGVNLEKFKPLPKDLSLMKSAGLEKGDLVILFVGRLVWEKGVYKLILSFKKLTDDSDIKTNIKLLFVGDGPEKKKMTGLIKKWNILGNVRFMDRVSYDEIQTVHNIADIFVLPSIPTRYWNEQYGMVLIEAMACGKPVVATYCGAIPEVVGDAGILVAPGDYLSLYTGLKNLISNEPLRKKLGENALKRAKEIYDARKVSIKLEELSKEVMEKKA